MYCHYCNEDSVDTMYDEDEDQIVEVCESHAYELIEITDQPMPVDFFMAYAQEVL